MSNEIGGFCESCGAVNQGTKFCESCGTPAKGAVASPTAQPAIVAPAVASPAVLTTGRRRTGARVAALIFFIIGDMLSWIFALVSQAGVPIGYASVVLQIIASVLVVILLIAAAAGGDASPGGKVGAVLLALLYLGLAATFALTALFVTLSPSVLYPLGGVEDLALFLAWGVGRPFRGPGYVGILFVVIADVIMDVIISQPGLLLFELQYGAALYAFLIDGLALVLLLSVIGLCILIERVRQPAASAGVISASGG